jgi:hypothetical protein
MTALLSTRNRAVIFKAVKGPFDLKKQSNAAAPVLNQHN